MAEPFYLFTCRHSGNYYVQFRLEDGTITAPKSTGTPNKKEAQLTAMRWLSSGEIPERVNSKDKSSKTKSLDLLEFWNYDVSPYRKERSTLGKELSYTYFETALGRIKKYWAPRLEGRYIGDITPDDIAAIYSDLPLKDLQVRL